MDRRGGAGRHRGSKEGKLRGCHGGKPEKGKCAAESPRISENEWPCTARKDFFALLLKKEGKNKVPEREAHDRNMLCCRFKQRQRMAVYCDRIFITCAATKDRRQEEGAKEEEGAEKGSP